MRRFRLGLAALTTLCVLTLAAGCGNADRPSLADEKAAGAAETATTTTPTEVTTVATVATPTVEVFGQPDDPEPTLTVEKPGPGLQAPEDPLAFVVNEQQGDWLNVDLPIRPNGSTGWIRASEAELSEHPLHIEVALSEFTLRLFEGDEQILEAPVALGTDETPTPVGTFYTTTLLTGYPQPSAYGIAAFGISGFSETLESFSGGPPQIAIHGTYGEEALGQKVSNGCIRVSNDVAQQLMDNLDPHLGVPVTVSA
jgi:lipoprotein-anchoring transpeptidase ErfK/SrfK